MTEDPFGNILPDENTILKVKRYELDSRNNKKEDQRDWIAIDENNKQLRYKVGNRYKDVKISGAFAPVLRNCNAVKYKRVNNPDMFCGDSTNYEDPGIKGFAWIPCAVWNDKDE